MPLIKGGVVFDDPWVFLADDAPLPAAGPVCVSLDRWQAERPTLRGRPDGVGVVLKSDQPAEEVAGDVANLKLIALEFPFFRDGRAYSTARLLRERYAYRGELRAVGNVLQDQFLFMLRCGFDAFQVRDDKQVAAWSKAVSAFSAVYQPGADGRMPLARLRGRARAAE